MELLKKGLVFILVAGITFLFGVSTVMAAPSARILDGADVEEFFNAYIHR